MKSRVFSFTSMLAMLVAMIATTSAFAQTSPGEEVYNPVGEVLSVVEGGGSSPVPASGTENSGTENSAATSPQTQENGATAPASSGCAEGTSGSGSGSNGSAGSSGSSCAPTPAAVVTTGQLPFTGFQAGLVALAGFALLGTGFAMRRFARTDVA